jgi:hypothetical protein
VYLVAGLQIVGSFEGDVLWALQLVGDQGRELG